jgi:hypothetical protein
MQSGLYKQRYARHCQPELSAFSHIGTCVTMFNAR